jgi:hypothetical protein
MMWVYRKDFSPFGVAVCFARHKCAVMPEASDVLVRVREKYKVKGHALKDQGYAINDKDTQTWFWFARDWDTQEEIWYFPCRPDRNDRDVSRPGLPGRAGRRA